MAAAYRAQRTPRYIAAAAASSVAFLLLLMSLRLPVLAASSPPPTIFKRPSGASVTLCMGNAAHGKLDIYLELSGPESARAWPTLKQAYHDYRDRIEFVFHIGPLPNSPIALAVAKAAFFIDAAGSDGERMAFFDQIFLNQELIMDGSSRGYRHGHFGGSAAAIPTGAAVADERFLDDWAIPVTNNFSVFDFVKSIEDEMEDDDGPSVDVMLVHSLSSMATTPLYHGLRVAPAVYMGDTLMLYLHDVHHGGGGSAYRGRDGVKGKVEGGGFNAALWEFLDDFLLWKANSILVAEAPTLHDASYWHY